MKKIKNIFLGAMVVTTLASCSVTLPQAVTDNPIGAKKGVSKTGMLFGAIQLNGDYGIAEAAKKGKIKGAVSTVDLKTTRYFWLLYYTKELIVTGDAE